jgi:hypothetical protein
VHECEWQVLCRQGARGAYSGQRFVRGRLSGGIVVMVSWPGTPIVVVATASAARESNMALVSVSVRHAQLKKKNVVFAIWSVFSTLALRVTAVQDDIFSYTTYAA